jgi:hypothetical protein
MTQLSSMTAIRGRIFEHLARRSCAAVGHRLVVFLKDSLAVDKSSKLSFSEAQFRSYLC